MDLSGRPKFLELRSADDALVTRWTQESRLCDIIESEHTPAEEKYRALIDLAYLSGVLSRELADAA